MSKDIPIIFSNMLKSTMDTCDAACLQAQLSTRRFLRTVQVTSTNIPPRFFRSDYVLKENVIVPTLYQTYGLTSGLVFFLTSWRLKNIWHSQLETVFKHTSSVTLISSSENRSRSSKLFKVTHSSFYTVIHFRAIEKYAVSEIVRNRKISERSFIFTVMYHSCSMKSIKGTGSCSSRFKDVQLAGTYVQTTTMLSTNTKIIVLKKSIGTRTDDNSRPRNQTRSSIEI